jgi:hypothetical protein
MFSGGATILAESLHPAEKNVIQYHFSNAHQNILDGITKRSSICEFISSQKSLNMAEKIKVRRGESGEYSECGALFIALRSIKSNVTFAV